VKNEVVINPESLFEEMEQQRAKGTLDHDFGSSPIKYQLCQSNPDYLEQIDINGIVTIGSFKDGKFFPVEDQ